MHTLEETKMRQALLRAAELMSQHGLGNWRVDLHTKRRVLADCNSMRKTIRFSKHFVEVAGRDEFERVTLHEISHALVGPRHGHDAVFKRKCREITPGQAYDGVSVPPNTAHIYKYKLTCPECGVEGGTNRKKSSAPICRACSKSGKLVEFVTSLNKINVKVW